MAHKLKQNQAYLDKIYGIMAPVVDLKDADQNDVEGIRYVLGYRYGFYGKELDVSASDSFRLGWNDGVGDRTEYEKENPL